MNLPSFNRNIDIICFSLSRWDAPISSPAASLAKELSKNNRVFYIEHPYSLKDYITEGKSYRQYDDGKVRVITPPLVYPINFLPEGKLYNWFSSLNNEIVLKTLRKVIAQNNVTDYIFINFFDPFFFAKHTKRHKTRTVYLPVHGRYFSGKIYPKAWRKA